MPAASQPCDTLLPTVRVEAATSTPAAEVDTVTGTPAPSGTTRRPRVGLVATRAYPDLGGIESHVENLLSRLDGSRWDLDLVVSSTDRTLPAHDVRHGVPLRRHRAFPGDRDWYISPGIFLDVLRGRRDLLHIHGINALVPPVAMLAAVLSRTPFVLTFHSGGANTGFRRRIRSTQWRVLGPLLRRARALVAVSASEAATFEAVVRRGTIPVIPNGSFDLPAPAGVEADPDLVLSVGRLEQYKGHQRLVEAVPHLLRTRPRLRVRILGTGPYEPALRALVARLDLTDRVTITSVPPQDREAMARELATAGAVVLLSDYEAHPVVVMEAVSLGRPVVARRNSGLVQFIDDGQVDGVPDDADAATVAAGVDTALRRGSRPVPVLPTWDECAAGVETLYARLTGTAVETSPPHRGP